METKIGLCRTAAAAAAAGSTSASASFAIICHVERKDERRGKEICCWPESFGARKWSKEKTTSSSTSSQAFHIWAGRTKLYTFCRIVIPDFRPIFGFPGGCYCISGKGPFDLIAFVCPPPSAAWEEKQYLAEIPL